MIVWDAPDPYNVAFTTRVGGVSGGPFESLNLGALTDDDPHNVAENRRRACDAVGADAETATMAWQHHSAEVRKAEARGIVTPGTQFERCDGLWSDEPGQAMMLLAAGARALGGGRLSAAIGPGIGPCCYEVAADVAEPFRRAYGDDVLTEGRLDLWAAAERALSEAGCAEVERTDLCTFCHPELFFSHRRDRGLTGRQGIVAYIG